MSLGPRKQNESVADRTRTLINLFCGGKVTLSGSDGEYEWLVEYLETSNHAKTDLKISLVYLYRYSAKRQRYDIHSASRLTIRCEKTAYYFEFDGDTYFSAWFEDHFTNVINFLKKIHGIKNNSDEMFDRMQIPEAREAMDRAFNATPEEMGRAAVEVAKKKAEQNKPL